MKLTFLRHCFLCFKIIVWQYFNWVSWGFVCFCSVFRGLSISVFYEIKGGFYIGQICPLYDLDHIRPSDFCLSLYH